MSKIFIEEGHAQNILQRMQEQREDEQLCDVVLIAGTEETRIPAHRAVLRASSEKFNSMITSAFTESNTREAKLPSEDGEILKALVEYSYSGRIEIKEEIVEKLIAKADSLHLGAVVNACGEFIVEPQLHPTNCLRMAQLAKRHNCKILLEKCQILCMKHFTEIRKTDEFLGLDAELLGQLLASDDLQVPNEADVFKSLMTWLAHDPIEREQHKDNLLKLVRMPLMKPSFLVDHVKSVCTSNASSQLYVAATEWHLLPERRAQNESKSTKPRKSPHQFLMTITAVEDEKLNLWYHCPDRVVWKKCEDLEYRRGNGAAVMDDDLFIVGGRYVDGDALNTVICLSLKTMTFKDVNPMNERRRGVSVAAFQGFLYAMGGFNTSDSFLKTIEKWDPESKNWSIVASMATERAYCATAILNNKLYVVGGRNGSDYLSSVEFYDPQTNAWTTVASMNQSYHRRGAAVVNGMLYAVGTSKESISIERYDPKTNEWKTLISSVRQGANKATFTSFYGKLLAFFNDRVEEYSSDANEWKVNASIGVLNGFKYHTFSYSGQLLWEKFF